MLNIKIKLLYDRPVTEHVDEMESKSVGMNHIPILLK